MVDKVIRGLRELLHAVASALLAVVLVTVFLQVVFRYVLQMSVPFTEEAARYFAIWMVFLGAAVAVARDAHIRITFLPERTRGGWRLALRLLSAVLVLSFNLILLVGSLQLVRLNWNQTATTFPVTVGVLYIAVALSAVCSILFALHQFRRWQRDDGG